MSKNQNNNKNKKNITVAQIAFASSLIAILCMYALFKSPIQPAVGAFGFWMLSSMTAFILGLLSLLSKRKQTSKADKALAIFSIVVPAIMIIIVLFLPRVHADHAPGFRIVCATNLKGLGVAMHIYSQEYKDKKYPTPDNWCDLLVKYADVGKKQFMCKRAKQSGNTKRSPYAINPNCEPNSPNDVVLLFEAKGGWNQYGGPELLNFEHHKGEGCNVLFNDGSVRFIKPKGVNGLNWGDEQKQ